MNKGPMFGYHAEPTKSWLIVKEELLEEANQVFAGAGVNITSQGKKHLGAVIGHPEYKHEFVEKLVNEWTQQIKSLAEIAAFEPQAAYTAFTSCIRHKYTFYLRTIPNISELLQPLEDAIRSKLIPALTEGRNVTDDERLLLSLPARLGGMGIISPMRMSDMENEFSNDATSVLTSAIINQQKHLHQGLSEISKEAKSKISAKRKKHQSEVLTDLKSRMTDDQIRSNEVCCEAGASNWLTSLPINDKGFSLSKHEFWDAINLRYGWPISRLSSKCACGANFDVGQALSCKKGGFIAQRHNELRDMTADLLAEVCHDVCVEPPLNQLSGESFSHKTANTSDEARLDISARSVWARNQRSFFYIRVFDPKAQRFRGQSLQQTYVTNEKEKKRVYNERVLQVENGTFTPLVFSVTGGMGQECKVFFKRVSLLIADKRNEKLSAVSSWIRTRTSFALLRSSLMCLRGSRHRYFRSVISEVDMELDISESIVKPI